VLYTSGYLIDAIESLGRRRSFGNNSRERKGLHRRLLEGPRSLECFRIDFRLLLVGSLLPDIIDKPLVFWLLPELVNHNARSIGHSLAFNLALLAIALLALVVFRLSGPLVLVLSSLGHVLLDQMWQLPDRFLWPLYGWQFPPGTTSFDDWAGFHLSLAWVDAPEMIGAAFLFWFSLRLWRLRAMVQFLKRGTLGESQIGGVRSPQLRGPS
jgi:inner membrane protein